MGGLNKADGLPQGGWALSNQLKVGLAQKVDPPLSQRESLPDGLFLPSDDWNWNAGSPGAPACQLELLGLGSLRNHGTQVLVRWCVDRRMDGQRDRHPTGGLSGGP